MSEEKIIIEEPKEEIQEEIEVNTDGLSIEEIEAGKESGVIKTDGKKEAKKEDGHKEEGSEDKVLDPADFEEMEEAYNKDETKFHKNFTSNAKALYFKAKRNKQLRQEAQEEAETLKKEKEFLGLKEKSYQNQLKEIEDLIDKIEAGDENITTSDIRKVLKLKKDIEEKVEDLKEEKKDDKSKKEEAYLAEKMKNAHLLGKSKYEDFDNIVALANEVVAQDKEIALIITKAYRNPEVDEAELVEKIVKYAKLHPKFGEEPKKEIESEKDSKKVERILSNSQKKKSSASLTPNGGRREVSYDELTIDDVQHMTQEQWGKLPEQTRKRLLQEAN